MSRRLALICLFLTSAALAGSDQDAWKNLEQVATQRHGIPGRNAARFLLDNHPARDNGLDSRILDETLEYALKARDEFPWTRRLSNQKFHNDVLPYASLDETREPWRKKFYEICKPFVADCKTATEAACAVNQNVFNAVNVHYNTDRSKTNQSPAEAIAEGRATCTGLSILLVDACRSVGIPARIAGVANWNGKEGNHTWVEVWDDGWHFLGADEPDRRGVDHAWFVRDAMKAIPGDPKYAIWATSFEKSPTHFPMVWNIDDRTVPGVDVTERYLTPFKGTNGGALRFVRLWTKEGGDRVCAVISILNENGRRLRKIATRAGTSDLNDMPSFTIVPETQRRLIVEYDGQARSTIVSATDDNVQTLELYWDTLTPLSDADSLYAPLSKANAEAIVTQTESDRAEAITNSRKNELDAHVIEAAHNKLRLLEKTFGDAPADGRSLWISLHGGGGAPESVNDQQWQNQITLYEPAEGIYIAPRAPTDTWNLWHQEHIDPLLDRLIETYVAARNVNPDKVYLLGYSAGGDGVYQLAPRMADRFAAASMMAGHPNEAKPLGLRNLPFAIFAGADDDAYNRNTVAANWGKLLDDLRANDPDGYPHRTTIYPGLGHWMNGKDKEAIPWMAAQSRHPWPDRVVWYQDDVTHNRFYWLKLRKKDVKQGQTIIADVKGQTITIQSSDVNALTLRLRDTLVDLDLPIKVVVNDVTVFEGRVSRTRAVIEQTLRERNDAPAAATAELPIDW
ncbi:MAG: hypothetical protein H6819_05390 [Phycisphaerales bacterium]|nr:hypothetical protein [Phycisphaerales bacterium]MCB9854787.1 hypothetical protein [Phycisphaerales bacterium]MCB9863741.1 hypothetical protein [Phycisphaerales bacterium]